MCLAALTVGLQHVKALALMLVLTSLALAGGCGDDDSSTSSTGASEATGAGSGGDDALNAEAQATARKAQTAIETYADDNNGSYAGASATGLSETDPSLSAGDLEVVFDRQLIHDHGPLGIRDDVLDRRRAGRRDRAHVRSAG